MGRPETITDIFSNLNVNGNFSEDRTQLPQRKIWYFSLIFWRERFKRDRYFVYQLNSNLHWREKEGEWNWRI